MNRVREISSLPEVTTRIVEVVEDPKSTAQDMHEIVRHDPALAAKVLKVVNSAFYGLPSQIASLDRAIVMLGLSAVKNIALAASLSRLFRPGSISARFASRDLWTHCVAVGVCTRLLAQASFGHVEEAFVAGLVHDMGLLVEFQLFPEKLKAVAERCEAQPQDFRASERELIGGDHQAFGAALASKWKFPPGLRCAISRHHDPENLKPELRRTVTAVRLADTICCHNELGFFLTAQTQDITDDMLEYVGVTEQQVSELLEGLPEQIKETEQIFGE
jgi:putative nucleotidyltransferase with HDIG domain